CVGSVVRRARKPDRLASCNGLRNATRPPRYTTLASAVVHNMTAIIQNLKQNRAFFARYHAENGTGIGERNALSGLAPVGLFMKILGVEILSATRVRLEGENPFPWDVTIQYKGLKVIRGQAKTEIIFADGKSVTITGIEATTVSL
ncbi:MAG: hypothetical protein ABI986_07590, partial [Chloroflexota bacterium]